MQVLSDTLSLNVNTKSAQKDKTISKIECKETSFKIKRHPEENLEGWNHFCHALDLVLTPNGS